jgi:hypothetical protein
LTVVSTAVGDEEEPELAAFRAAASWASFDFGFAPPLDGVGAGAEEADDAADDGTACLLARAAFRDAASFCRAVIFGAGVLDGDDVTGAVAFDIGPVLGGRLPGGREGATTPAHSKITCWSAVIKLRSRKHVSGDGGWEMRKDANLCTPEAT